jgi:hypothetical protein
MTSGEKRKREAANSALAFDDIHHPAAVLIGVAAQHVPDHVVTKRERRLVIEQHNAAEIFPVPGIAAAN